MNIVLYAIEHKFYYGGRNIDALLEESILRSVIDE
jgi:hypothetical protein